MTINVIAKCLKGYINITPSTIRFEPAFSGLFQSKILFGKSTFNNDISILSAESLDPRIIPELLTNSIKYNNRTELLRITFDPSKGRSVNSFMKGDFRVNITNNRYLTYKELFLWKENNKVNNFHFNSFSFSSYGSFLDL